MKVCKHFDKSEQEVTGKFNNTKNNFNSDTRLSQRKSVDQTSFQILFTVKQVKTYLFPVSNLHGLRRVQSGEIAMEH